MELGGLDINFRFFGVLVAFVLGYRAEVWAPKLLFQDPFNNDCERVHLFALKWMRGVRKSTCRDRPRAFRWVQRITRFYNGLVKATS